MSYKADLGTREKEIETVKNDNNKLAISNDRIIAEKDLALQLCSLITQKFAMNTEDEVLELYKKCYTTVANPK